MRPPAVNSAVLLRAICATACLAMTACGGLESPNDDAGTITQEPFDAGTLDGGTNDAGTIDAGTPEFDAGTNDAGTIDAGTTEFDAGTESDAGSNSTPTYDLDHLGIPKFVDHDYIDMSQLTQISRFRSGIGHDYSDDVEHCRSMKHYHVPRSDLDWTTLTISAPTDATIETLMPEPDWGTQVWMEADAQPAFHIVIFHVTPAPMLQLGQHVTAGEPIGTHASSQTWSDLAVHVVTPTGQRLVSYYDVMTDAHFQTYAAYGITDRSQLIITRAERDADPLSCDAMMFLSEGTLPNWVNVTP